MAVLCDDQIRTTVGIAPPAEGQPRMHANEGIAQVMFLQAQQICTTSYCGQSGQASALNGTNRYQIRKDRTTRQGRPQDRHMDHGRTKVNG